MRAYFRIALPVLTLLLGVGGAAANDSPSTGNQATSEYPSHPIALSTEQQKLVWQRITNQPVASPPPLSALPVPPGQVVPNDIPLQSMPDDVTANIPSLKGYVYAIVQDRILIVNPSDKTVGHVIDTNQLSIR